MKGRIADRIENAQRQGRLLDDSPKANRDGFEYPSLI